MRKKIILFIIVIFLSLELYLRFAHGFGSAVLVQEDSDMEYLAKPNQDLSRYGNQIQYNSVSMRSEKIDSTAITILGFGDSVINGGMLTGQDSLATTILSDSLSEYYGEKTQFLNISMGSWGPDNCYAYLKKFGDFKAKAIFLFVSSHDAYDSMDFEKIVGVNKSFPNKQYPLAMFEVIDRYLVPRLGKLFNDSNSGDMELGINKRSESSKFNTGFESFQEYAKSRKVELIVYLHADKDELSNGSYNAQGKEIIKFVNDNDLTSILDLNNGLDSSHFRDNIHLNNKGQKHLAKTILKNWDKNID